MRLRRRSVDSRKSAIDVAVASMAAAQVGADSSPEWAALLLATEESASAGKARSALGGYVPIGHPGHPSKWSTARQDALADANADVLHTTEALRIATLAHVNRTVLPD